MLYFFDTSALVKRYRQEIGTETIDEIFAERINVVAICSISICEFCRAIDAHSQRKEISPVDAQKIIERFYVDLHTQRILIMEIGRERLFRANEIILKYHLSAADAIILSSALALQDTNPIFVCADVRSGLLHAAADCRLSTLNPLSIK